MRRGNSIKGNEMDAKDYGKNAICGVNGESVIVSKYNIKCPCINCVGCKNMDNQSQCAWRHTLEINPCTNEDMREIMCVNCVKENQEHKR
jgi:hypothetical protein